MEEKKILGKKIKEKRLQLDLRMEDVAKKIGITRATLWSIENGEGNYSIDTLIKLLHLLKMNIEINESELKSRRRRASKANTLLDKEINRFIVMSIMQYSCHVKKESDLVFRQLNEKGIINELKEDYEDMHGMSTYSINEYIDKRLNSNNSIEVMKQNTTEHLIAKIILITQTIELIAKKYKLSLEEARNQFYESFVIEMLEDDETGLYGSSSLYLLSLYENYIEKNYVKIVGDNYFGNYNKTRYACRGVIIQNDQLLMTVLVSKDLWMIPGGGNENGENEEACVVRELSEETGYEVLPIKKAVRVIEYYEDVRYVSTYFICNIQDETTTNLTDAEKKAKLEKRWISLKDALSIFSCHNEFKDSYEEKRGAYLREYSALMKMIENNFIAIKK